MKSKELMNTLTYPVIFALFDPKDIPLILNILNAVNDGFPDLFNFNIIEKELENKRKDGSYVLFFKSLIQELLQFSKEVKDPTQAALIHRTTLLFNENVLSKHFREKLVFVPDYQLQPSRQLAFHEKVAAGQLQQFEPVTFLDMLRITYYLQQFKNQNVYASLTTRIHVLNLRHIRIADFTSSYNTSSTPKTLVVDFNLKADGIAKWGIISIEDRHNPLIYCDVPLLDCEKTRISSLFSDKCTCKFEDAKSREVNLTGYATVDWLNANIYKAWHFETQADFQLSFSNYIFMMFRGEKNTIIFSPSDEEYNRFFSMELKGINAQNFWSKDRISVHQFYNNMNNIKTQPSKTILYGYLISRIFALTLIRKCSIQDMIIELSQNPMNEPDFNAQVGSILRSSIPGFINTLKMSQFLNHDFTGVELDVSQPIDKENLIKTHQECCAPSTTNARGFEMCQRLMLRAGKVENIPSEDMAAAMVLNVFRSFSKTPVITLKLHSSYQLTKEEHNFISILMKANPYVTELRINNNDSLLRLQRELLPYFARNRWLHANEYKPLFKDDYWKKMAEYWLIHLAERDYLLETHKEVERFKNCVKEMGLMGLRAVFSLLNDPNQRQRLEGMLAQQKLTFYADWKDDETLHCLNQLTNHSAVWFPFSELEVVYKNQFEDSYIKLLNSLNQSQHLKHITLNVLDQHQQTLPKFLQQAAECARRNHWTVTIAIIPAQVISEMAVLNNIIIKNRHDRQIALTQPVNHKPRPNKVQLATDSAKVLSSLHKKMKISATGPWPLMRGGVVQTQIQQQQQHEIQQSRQVQLQKQRLHLRVRGIEPVGELVTYDNVERLLAPYYQKLKISAENVSLQSYFRQWISANPTVVTPDIIVAMTQEAARTLLRFHLRFTSGLHPENPVKGFYTEMQGQQLVLFYDAAQDQVSEPDPLTLELYSTKHPAANWQGDYLLFGEKDEHRLLFNMLNPDLSDIVFDASVAALLLTGQSSSLSAWALQTLMGDRRQFMALGQIFYSRGDQGLKIFLEQLYELQQSLGAEFFKQFNQNVLSHSSNYDSFVNAQFFKAIKDMGQKLKGGDRQQQAWHALCRTHMAAVHWEEPQRLWEAFDYFLEHLDHMDLQLTGNEFDELSQQNMLVGMDNIIASLKCLNSRYLQELFLKSLSRLDLTRGGVHYAIQREGFQYFNKDLQLENFTQGQPTYNFNLDKLFSEEFSALSLRRILAVHAGFDCDNYNFLSESLIQSKDRHALVILLFTQYDKQQSAQALEVIVNMDHSMKTDLADYLFQQRNSNLQISLKSLQLLAGNVTLWQEFKRVCHSSPAFALEALSILAHDNACWSLANDFLQLFEQTKDVNQTSRDAYKLAALCGEFNSTALMDYLPINGSNEAGRQWQILLSQLLSIQNIPVFSARFPWKNLLKRRMDMHHEPAQSEELRRDYIAALQQQGVIFKYSRSGKYRGLEDKDKDRISAGLQAFPDHRDRLWSFLQNHILIPVDKDARKTCADLLLILRKMQLSHTSLNELEHLLGILEKEVPLQKFWTVDYFTQMLQAIYFDEEYRLSIFPLEVFRVLITHVSLRATDRDEVTEHFPVTLGTAVKDFIKNKCFNPEQQKFLCQLLLTHPQLLPAVIALLSPAEQAQNRSEVLQFLGNGDAAQRFELINILFADKSKDQTWSATLRIWLKLLTDDSEAIFLLQTAVSNSKCNNVKFIGPISFKIKSVIGKK